MFQMWLTTSICWNRDTSSVSPFLKKPQKNEKQKKPRKTKKPASQPCQLSRFDCCCRRVRKSCRQASGHHCAPLLSLHPTYSHQTTLSSTSNTMCCFLHRAADVEHTFCERGLGLSPQMPPRKVRQQRDGTGEQQEGL